MVGVTAARGGGAGAVAASPPTEEAAQLTEPLTKEDLVAYLVSGCKPKETGGERLRHGIVLPSCWKLN